MFSSIRPSVIMFVCPSVRCQHNVRLSVRPSVRCQHNVRLSVSPSVSPSVRCQHNVRLSVRPLVRPCGANIIYFSKESTYLWFIYSRRCGVVCPTELGLLHFLKGMVFQVSELSQKQLLLEVSNFCICFRRSSCSVFAAPPLGLNMH